MGLLSESSFLSSRTGDNTHVSKGTDKNEFYRFTNPTVNDFPNMIELFSRKPDYLREIDTALAPVHVSDELQSLSAILLDDEYYDLLRNNAAVVNGCSVLNQPCLILFKMKAWLDLSERRAKGETVDAKDIRKHRNDVLRLTAGLEPKTSFPLTGKIRGDAECFLHVLENDKDKIVPKQIGLQGVSTDALIERLIDCFCL